MVWNSSLYAVHYVLLPLVNKEGSLIYGKAEYSQVGNPDRYRDKEGRVRETQVSAREARCDVYKLRDF